MSNSRNENSSLLPTTEHTHYQSIGPSEPEETETAWPKLFTIILTILATILVLGVMAYGLLSTNEIPPLVYNNGTHEFMPTVLFISLDGVVNHDLDLGVTPILSKMGKQGSKAQYMTPSFPPITFPNHWSLVTGLYPESHGIVGNYFYDSQLNDSFYYKSPSHSWDAKWWGGEPIWITAVRQNKKSAVIMWPGCSTSFNGDRPTYNVDFNDNMSIDEKVSQVFDWLDFPVEERPQFIGMYVQQVDQAGHAYGPYANETMKALAKADIGIGKLLSGLKERNLTDIVNVMVVSDHGMSETDASRLIYYDDILTKEELAMIWKVETEPTLGIRPFPDLDQSEAVETLYQAFVRLHKSLAKPHFQVYKREDFPSRFHFRDNVRIAPLLVLPDPGWNLVTRERFDPTLNKTYNPRGVHGYDNISPESRAIFVAKGPDFPKEEEIQPFWNIELYSVMSNILGLKPAANNNTLNGLLQIASQ
ncbi:Phosphodiest-domain-containing protein [Backusella circina FSU 941]|nr:Phosphodiest-domain-containing protein [Backusella circina FSU 941]